MLNMVLLGDSAAIPAGSNTALTTDGATTFPLTLQAKLHASFTPVEPQPLPYTGHTPQEVLTLPSTEAESNEQAFALLAQINAAQHLNQEMIAAMNPAATAENRLMTAAQASNLAHALPQQPVAETAAEQAMRPTSATNAAAQTASSAGTPLITVAASALEPASNSTTMTNQAFAAALLANDNSKALSPSQQQALQQALQGAQAAEPVLPNAFNQRMALSATQQQASAGNPLASIVPVQQAFVEQAPLAAGAQAMAQNEANATNSQLTGLSVNNTSTVNPQFSASLTAPLASAGWQQQLGQQVANMHIRQDNQIALRLHPAELGPLMIQLKVDEQSAALQFSSQHAGVRSAVEAAIPQLRELLAEQGIQLSDSSINDGSSFAEQNSQERSDSSPAADNTQIAQDIASEAQSSLEVQVGNGQIDLYA